MTHREYRAPIAPLGTFADQSTSFYDLFRIKNSKIAEHWDVWDTIKWWAVMGRGDKVY